MLRSLIGIGFLVCSAFLTLAVVRCDADKTTLPCPVYMTNHSTLALWIEVSQTREFNENTVQDYTLGRSDSLFLGYFPNGYSFWLWGEVADVRVADTSCFIEYPVEVEVSGKTLLVLDDSLGEPVLNLLH